MYRLIIHRRAASYLQKLPLNQQEPLKVALKRLAENPFNSPHVKAMAG
jgi:mRNA-degrading endonuclease RelE of RelBE toxin-antitoxin system